MGEIIQFPGKFQKSESESVKKAEKRDEKKPELKTPDNETGSIPAEEELGEIMENIKIRVGTFLDKIKAIKNTNSRMAWSGNNAREMLNLVKDYTFEELVSWAVKATDTDINTKPFFFHAIALEILRRLDDRSEDEEE